MEESEVDDGNQVQKSLKQNQLMLGNIPVLLLLMERKSASRMQFTISVIITSVSFQILASDHILACIPIHNKVDDRYALLRTASKDMKVLT